MARGGIRLVHGHTKSALIRYFSGMKIDPKYSFLHAFFLICPSCPFQNLSIWPKTPFFSNFTHICTPKRCTRVQFLVLKNNPNYVNFWTSLIPPWHSSAPPRTYEPTNCCVRKITQLVKCTKCVKLYTSCVIFLTQQLVGSYASQC